LKMESGKWKVEAVGGLTVGIGEWKVES